MDHRAGQEPGYAEFIHLFDTFKGPVHGYIQQVTKDFHIAEELTQELFIRLWKKRDSYHTIENKEQYIFRMAHNACMSWFQKLALDAKLAKEVKGRMQLENNNVEDHVRLAEAKALLEKAILQLSPQRRKVFELSRHQGMKLQEIAEELNLSASTVNHHLVAALAQVREFFLQNSKDKALIFLLFALVR